MPTRESIPLCDASTNQLASAGIVTIPLYVKKWLLTAHLASPFPQSRISALGAHSDGWVETRLPHSHQRTRMVHATDQWSNALFDSHYPGVRKRHLLPSEVSPSFVLSTVGSPISSSAWSSACDRAFWLACALLRHMDGQTPLRKAKRKSALKEQS
jgi:hypothetical protein